MRQYLILGLLFLGVSPVHATTIHVQSEQPTIQVGIDAVVSGAPHWLRMVCTSSTLFAQGVDPGQADTLRIDSTVAFVSGVGVVPVTLFNDEALSVLEITLLEPSSEVHLDSFAFSGGRFEPDGNNIYAFFESGTKLVLLSWFEAVLLPAGDGLIGHLYLSYSHTITPQVVQIDTSTVVDNQIVHETLFQGENPLDDPFIPQVQRGYLDIQADVPPPCCIDTMGSIRLDDGITDCDDLSEQIVDVADLTNLIDHLFINFTPICCRDEADFAPLMYGGPQDGFVDVADLTAMIDHLFINFPTLPECP